MKKNNKIIIIGGGASGMVAAITAARKGGNVTILEQKSELGKKILATGNGRCNFTNLKMSSDYFYCQQNEFIDNLLAKYTPEVVIDFFNSIGVLKKDRDGYVYPLNDQARSLRDALVNELSYLGVDVRLDCTVNKLTYVNSNEQSTHVKIDTNQGVFNCNTLILSTGGKSGLANKDADNTFDLLCNLKHTHTNLSPALVPLKGQGKFFKKIAGIRTDAKVIAKVDNQEIRHEIGELQLTDYGISGIPIFQISRILTQELSKQNHGELSVEIDFLPSYTLDELENLLVTRKKLFANRTVIECLNGIFKDKLISFLLYTARIEENNTIANISLEELAKFARISKSFNVQINGSKDFAQSQVTAGGIPLTELNEYLESKFHPNIYFTGELLDVDGICGGYNLHFAWISGMLVGERCVNP